MGVPSNLVPTRLTEMPLYNGTSLAGTIYYVLGGVSYQTQLSTLGVGTGTVTSVDVSGGTTGLSFSGGPVTTTGTITMAGTLAVANGGTGLTSLGANVANWMQSPSSANLALAVSDETGSGALVFATSPNFVTPNLGVPSAGTLTSCVGLPIATGVSGLGTGVATALAVDVGSAGAFVVNGGALGTPSSGTLSGCSGLPIASGVSGLGSGVATMLATFSSANIASACTDETGSGALVFGTAPTFTQTVTLDAAETGFASLNMPHGTAPSVPVNGDMWTTTSGLYARINGGTVGPLSSTTGTVTSVGGTGTVNGLTLSGTVTTSGSLTLGGTLAISNADWSGTDLAIGNGGTGASTAQDARLALLPAVAANTLKVLRVNAGETDVEWATAATGTVTSVGGTGTVNGLTLSGTVTSSGSITLGGTLAVNNADWSGTDLAVANGGTGASTAQDARLALLPAVATNALKVLRVNAGETDVEWAAGGGGGVTSVDVSGGTTGLSFSGGPITTSGTITMAGTLAVANGGTGAATAADARTNLGLVIGTNVQAYDAELAALAGTTSAADALPYFTGVGTASTTTLTLAARGLLDDATVSDMRTTLGLAIGTNVQAYDADLTTWAGITPGTGVGTALAVNVGTAGAFVVNGGAGGTPSSLTLTNATGLPVAGITSSTSTALGVGSLEVGHASDTTIARVSAGKISVEGVNVVTTSSTDTLTNKTLTAPAISDPVLTGSVVEDVYALSTTTPAIDGANGGIQTWTLTGNSTPTDSISAGQVIMLLIDDGTAYTITWTSVVDQWIGGSAPTLPTTGYAQIMLFKVSTTVYACHIGNYA